MARPRQHSDEQILAVARKVFLENGPQVATSVIAGELGISAPALFHRFGNKRSLLLRAMAPTMPDFSFFDSAPDERPLQVQLLVIAREMQHFFRGLAPAMAVLKHAGIAPHEMLGTFEEPPPARVYRELAAWLRRGQEQGLVRPGNAQAWAMSFLGSMHIWTFLVGIVGVPAPGGDLEDYMLSVTTAFSEGLVPRGEL